MREKTAVRHEASRMRSRSKATPVLAISDGRSKEVHVLPRANASAEDLHIHQRRPLRSMFDRVDLHMQLLEPSRGRRLVWVLGQALPLSDVDENRQQLLDLRHFHPADQD